ncbi:hypothetical protein DY000_02031367 [Brassica cretica]|uniref:Uncharacterized protein n=1 Tax=Brassica cretica TaxID=69181 RepID=A0ABQ7DS34_BRACR|nr:hypothetical protein DY000_02031367 [Brassica cretica]
MHEEGHSRVTPRAVILNASVGNFPYQWKHEYQLSVTGELMYILGAQQKCLHHELKAMSLTKRFDNESSKDDKPEEQHQRSMLCDGCWSKLQELYINDSQDTSLITLHEHFALGKVCSTPLDETPDQLLWDRHIDVRHHFMFNLLEEKLAILRHKTSENQQSDMFKKPLDLNSLLYSRDALGIRYL